MVAPHVGAWIEMGGRSSTSRVGYPLVAPHVGAWIEIRGHHQKDCRHHWSLPMWERGLKL